MYPNIDHNITESATELLAETQILIRQNRVAEALDRVLLLRASQPRNIFIAGMEKQIRTLVEVENNDFDEIEAASATLQPLIDRAMESVRTQPPPKAIAAVEGISGKSDKAKAIEALKGQFFAHADRLTKKGDYESALGEINRILHLDQHDVSAREYVQKLEELLALQKATALQAEQERNTPHPPYSRAAQSTEKKFLPPPVSLNELVTMTKPDFDSIIAKTKPASYSLDLTPTMVPGVRRQPVPRKPGRKSSTLLFASAVFIIIAIAVSYFFTTTSGDDSAAPSTQVETASMKHQTAPASEPQGVQESAGMETPQMAVPESTAVQEPSELQTDSGREQ